MRGMLLMIIGMLILAGVVRAEPGAAPRVVLKTSKGDIVVELAREQAPQTVENFLAYVESGFYDDTIFHRVIPGFMIQGGGLTPEMVQKQTRAEIPNEADNGLLNERGTVAMARRPDPHSASAQFFINLTDNVFLNHQDKSPQGWGYAVFGRVVAGMETVEAIAAVETGRQGSFQDVPKQAVIIEQARRVADE